MRRRQIAAVACVALLGAAAAATLRHLRGSLGLSWAGLGSRVIPVLVTEGVSGAPAGLQAQVELFLREEAQGLSPAQRAEGLRRRFPWVKEVRLRRDWLRRSVRFELQAHRALGRAFLKGRPAGCLSEGGDLFAAPPGLYGESLPALEVEGSGSEGLKSLARYLAEVRSSADLLSPVQGMRWLSEPEGWEVRLADGTTVLWGRLDWTREKLARLREALLDARPQFGAVFSADLRYFEDGKVLLRPRGGGALRR